MKRIMTQKHDQIEEITFMMDKTDLCDLDDHDRQFIIDNNVSYIKNEMKYIKKIDMHFYQLWCLLGELPILKHTGTFNEDDVRRQGKTKYEWRFVRKDIPNVIFTIYDYNNKNNFLNTNVWYLASTTQCKVHNKEFVDTFIGGIQCYDMYYKGIETRDFTSDIPIVHQNLQRIRSELIEKRDLIKWI